MEQKYNDIGNYFDDLAKRHKEIKEFTRFELDELLGQSINFQEYPVFVLEGFDFDYAGSSPGNIIKSRNGAFCIVDICDTKCASSRMEMMEKTEAIAQEFLMKMVEDKDNRHKLLTTFSIADAEGVHALNPQKGLVMCRITFSFKTKIREETGVWE